MPNHVTTKLTLSGDQAIISKLKEHVKGGANKDDDGKESSFDFNKIIPMPIELEGGVSPTRVVSQSEYDEKMKLKEEGKLADWEGIPITHKMQIDFMNRFGADNWYDWRVQNWGTKWNCYQIFDENWENDNEIEFQTAWSNPLPILQELSRQFPEVKIEVRYYDEDFGSNVGEYTLLCGEVQELNIPRDITEGLRLAIDISGDDYHFTEGLVEYGEDHDFSESEYTQALIQIAHDNGVLLEAYPIPVLEKLKELAIECEQYERANEINKLIQKKGE